MAAPMQEPISARAGEALLRGQAVIPGTVPAGTRTTQLWLTLVAAAGAPAAGSVAMNQDTVGGVTSVVVRGTAPCLASAAVPAQSPITPAADSGWQVAATGHIVHGYSTTAAGAAGDLFEAELGTADAGRIVP